MYLLCLLCVLTLSSATLSSCTVTQQPALACVGEMVTVSCDLSVPSPNDNFLAFRTSFLVGSSGPIPESIVNGDTTIGGVDLSRLTADSPVGTTQSLQGTLNLLSYTLADNGLLLGCSIEYIINGDNSNTDFLVETVNLAQAAPPSSLVLTLSQPDDSCSIVLIWSTPSSDRFITSYSVFRDDVSIADVSNTTNEYTESDVTSVSVYHIVATSCAGVTTSNTVSSASIGVPSSPVVTLSQTDTSCSNINISWSTPSSDRPIYTYSVYRDNTAIYTATGTETTDNTQLSISTVYEYSVVAISCAGTSTAEVSSISIGEYDITSLTVAYDNSSRETLLYWVLSPLQPVYSLSFSIQFDYTLTQGNDTQSSLPRSIMVPRLSYETSYDITKDIDPLSFSGKGMIDTQIRVCIQITEQCGQAVSGMIICDSSDTVIHSNITRLSPGPDLGLIVPIVFVVCCLPILTGVTILIVYCILIKNGHSTCNSKKSPDTQEQEQTYSKVDKDYKKPKVQPKVQPPAKEMKGDYADLHEFPMSDNLKRSVHAPETLYTTVQPSSYRHNY